MKNLLRLVALLENNDGLLLLSSRKGRADSRSQKAYRRCTGPNSEVIDSPPL
jgi:hypothetical protein